MDQRDMSGPQAAAPATPAWLEQVAFDGNGLVAVVAQQVGSGRVLMLAWADRAALEATWRSGLATYWSRSRRRLWRKGEESGHTQAVREMRLDCDGDAVLYLVEQAGAAACHTGRESCFFRCLQDGRWVETDPVLVDPAQLYRKETT